MKMLSIIIPTYNSVKTIKRCINSILLLRDIKYEIILVDDGSIDGTARINDYYANRYGNVNSLHQHHGGVSLARDYALKYAKGSWTCFVDSDDSINAKNLENIYKKYANINNDLIVSNVNQNGQSVGLRHLNKKTCNIKDFLRDNYPIYGKFNIMDNSGKIYRTNIIKKYNIVFPPHITISEDSIFTLKFLTCIHKNIMLTSMIYYNYDINEGSSVENYDKNRINNVRATFKALKYIYNYFNLPVDAVNWIKIRLAYAILLNALRYPTNKIKMISNAKEQIYKLHLVPNKKYQYHKVECSILEFIIKQPVIFLLFLFIEMLHLRHDIRILHKF